MNPLPGDPSLPLGCSHRDIEEAQGEPTRCQECGAPISNDILCKRCIAAIIADLQRDEAKDNTP